MNYVSVTYDLPAPRDGDKVARRRAMNTLSHRARTRLSKVAVRVSASVYIFPEAHYAKVNNTVNDLAEAYRDALGIDLLGTRKIMILRYDASSGATLKQKAADALRERLLAFLDDAAPAQETLNEIENLMDLFEVAATPGLAALLRKAQHVAAKAVKRRPRPA